MAVLMKVQNYLRQTGMPPTVFGREVANDPRLFDDIINGREPRREMLARIDAFIAAHPERYR